VSDKTPWQTVLATPAPADHVAQLYQDDECLARIVAAYCAESLTAREAALTIATPSHLAAFARHLAGAGVDVDVVVARGQYTPLDAETCLAEFMRDGRPDRERFVACVAPHVDAARRAGYPRVRAYGEMVDILHGTDLPAALRLEELWNELLGARRDVSLLCAYRVDPFHRDAYRHLVPQIGRRHSHLLPVEDPAALELAVRRAFLDVFGTDADTLTLRDLYESVTKASTAMPGSQAALMNLGTFVPAVARDVLEASARHYRAFVASRDRSAIR
jgi:hypothetical protein